MRKIFFLSLIVYSFTACAADIESLKKLFKKSYYSSYQEGQCGQNIDRFIKTAHQLGINLSAAMGVFIGGSGDLWVYSARNETSTPDSRVWFHHYVLIAPAADKVDSFDDYLVFDFDFMNEPRVVSLKKYLLQMFIPANIREDEERIKKDISLAFIRFSGVDASVLDLYNQKSSEHIFEKMKFKDLYFSLR